MAPLPDPSTRDQQTAPPCCRWLLHVQMMQHAFIPSFQRRIARLANIHPVESPAMLSARLERMIEGFVAATSRN